MSEQKPSEDFLKASKALVYSRTAQGAGVGLGSGVGLGLILTVMVAGSDAHLTLGGLISAMAFFGGTGAAIGGGVGLANGSAERSKYIIKQLEAPKPQRALPPPAEPPAGPLI